MSTKLERLFIGEVSGVDDPANEIPGWMVSKSVSGDAVLFGPDRSWDVGEAEKRVREVTKATEGPNPDYANCFLWYDATAKDTNGDGVPDHFGDYKFLVADVVDGGLKVMPQAVDAVAARLDKANIPTSDKGEVGATIEQLQALIKHDSEPEQAATEEAQSIVERVKSLLRGKDEVDDMTKEELAEALDERDSALVEKLAERLATSVDAPAPGDGAVAEVEVTAVEDVPVGLTEEDVIKTTQEALQPVLEIMSKTLDRIERIEDALAMRKSLDGQEAPVVEEAHEPTVQDAIGAALKGRPVVLR